MERARSLLGVGIYSVPEAARMVDVSAPRIRRWLLGYQFKAGDTRRKSSPVWRPDLPVVDEILALSFHDLIEVRFVDYFLRLGVSWKVLRSAARFAAGVVHSTHPFSTQKFKTDGSRCRMQLTTRTLLPREVFPRQLPFSTHCESTRGADCRTRS